MKFSDANEETWAGLAPYVDTCLLPVTGLTGSEQPWEATQALERLRDASDTLEILYRGRVMTYPALHYCPDSDWEPALRSLCERLKQTGFKFVVIVTIIPELADRSIPEADAMICDVLDLDSDERKQFVADVRKRIEQLWRG